ncbi:hypothetical protein [Halovivax sp.]|uniref:hypothetical protein n=1 Tax=Halovivax sp. TaxID=1935978 RepID=UPI0025C6287E|nr:hypothetical protein [Halovivax sp.]
MPNATLADVEDALEEARDLPEEEALEVLRSAREDAEALRSREDVVEAELAAIEDRVDQRIREVEQRDAYDGGMGAATDADEEDAA